MAAASSAGALAATSKTRVWNRLQLPTSASTAPIFSADARPFAEPRAFGGEQQPPADQGDVDGQRRGQRRLEGLAAGQGLVAAAGEVAGVALDREQHRAHGARVGGMVQTPLTTRPSACADAGAAAAGRSLRRP